MPKFYLAIGFVFLAHLCLAQNSPRDYVNAHNTARSEAGVPAIAWDNSLAAWAQNYTNTLKANCQLVHSGGPYGENLAWSSANMSGTAAVGLWVAEKPFYNHNSNSCIGGNCQHYIQVIWQRSSRLGCAKVSCNNGGTLVSCNYDPPYTLYKNAHGTTNAVSPGTAVSSGSRADQAWLSSFPNGRPGLGITSLCPS